MATYQTNAIVLKREDIFEADRLYHLYTEDFGKVRVIAGSVRKIKAKLSGHMEPFNVVWAELVSKKNGDIAITTALSFGCLLKTDSNPNNVALFTKMSEFVLSMFKEPQKDAAAWNFIMKNFINAREVAIGSSDEFLADFKGGLANLLGFGDDFEKAKYYLGDFNVL